MQGNGPGRTHKLKDENGVCSSLSAEKGRGAQPSGRNGVRSGSNCKKGDRCTYGGVSS